MSFCTVVNCMDGRTQIPVNDHLRSRNQVEYVDTITEAGPVKALAEGLDSDTCRSVLTRVNVSVEKHGSLRIAVVAHHDCAGNPQDEETQKEQLEKAVANLAGAYPQTEVVGLWVDEYWWVHEICKVDPTAES